MSNASSKKIEAAVKTNKSRGLGGPIRVVATALVVFLLSQIIAAFFVQLILGIIHPNQSSASLIDSTAAQFFYILLAEALAVFLVFKILKSQKQSLKSIGLGRLPKGADIVKALLGFAAFFALIILVNIILNNIFPELQNQKQDIGFNTINSSFDRILAFISLVILVPIGEEVLFRGYLYTGLRTRLKFIPAMLITSTLFGIPHLLTGKAGALIWAAVVNTFVLSLVLVYLREKTGVLYASILVHALNNLIAFGVNFRGILF